MNLKILMGVAELAKVIFFLTLRSYFSFTSLCIPCRNWKEDYCKSSFTMSVVFQCTKNNLFSPT